MLTSRSFSSCGSLWPLWPHLLAEAMRAVHHLPLRPRPQHRWQMPRLLHLHHHLHNLRSPKLRLTRPLVRPM